MKNIIKKTLLGIVLLATTNLSAGQIIANINCPLSQRVLKGETINVIRFQQIFEGKIEKCTDGNIIQRFTLKEDNPIMEIFAQNIFKLSSIELFHKWKSIELTQGISKPTILSSEERMVRTISNIDNSVGMVSDETVLPPTVIKILSF